MCVDDLEYRFSSTREFSQPNGYVRYLCDASYGFLKPRRFCHKAKNATMFTVQ